MFKIKKKIEKPKPPVLYNVIEDYSEFDAPGNVTVCAMTLPENLPAHAKILSESYEVPLEQMIPLLTDGGVYVYPQVGGLLTRGLFAAAWMPLVPRPSRPGCSISCNSRRPSNGRGPGPSRWRMRQRKCFIGRCRRN